MSSKEVNKNELSTSRTINLIFLESRNRRSRIKMTISKLKLEFNKAINIKSAQLLCLPWFYIISCKMNTLSSGMIENNHFVLSFFYSPNSSKRYFDIGELRFSDDGESAQEAEFFNSLSVCQFVNQCMNLTELKSEKPYLMIINPQSGRKMGQKIFDGCVSKLFKRCNIKYEVLLTERPLHAKHFVKNCDSLYKYRGIITVSGDGLIYEVFCGVMDRDSWQQDLELVPISVIPAGSGNGLAASIAAFSGVTPDNNMILFNTLLLTQPMTQPLDLMRVQTSSGDQFPSFLSLTWGLMANVDVGSDKYRWMGGARFTVAATIQVAKMNKYKAKLWYLPASSYDEHEFVSYNVKKDVQTSNECDTKRTSFSNMAFRYLPDIAKKIPDNNQWVLLDQLFITVIVSLLPYLGTQAHIAPTAQINDGKIYIVIIHPEISRSELAFSISKLETGGHFNTKAVEYIECLAFRLIPECSNSYMAIDGELLQSTAIQAEVMPSAAKTFTGPCDNKKLIYSQ